MATHIIDTLEKCGYGEIGLYYIREERRRGYPNVKFSIMNNQLSCYNDDDGHLIFTVSIDISIGALLALFETFNIIDEAYVYAHLKIIEDVFNQID
jgi:hypothetical protein